MLREKRVAFGWWKQVCTGSLLSKLFLPIELSIERYERLVNPTDNTNMLPGS
jgi:hypothetical protein